MKKLFIVMFSFILVISLLSGCNDNTTTAEDASDNGDAVISETPIPNVTEAPTEDPAYTQAKEIARTYWEMTDDTATLDDGTQVAIFSSEDDFVVSNEIKYYHFYLKWLVLDENGSPSHYSTIDSVYVNTKTGECTYEKP